MKPLNGHASTHRWAHVAEGARGSAAHRLPVLHRSCATQRGPREEKRKWGARVRPERAGRILFAQNYRVTVRLEWMDDDERASVRPICQADFLAQDQLRPGVQERWCTRVGR
jgi:hypothetical protein